MTQLDIAVLRRAAEMCIDLDSVELSTASTVDAVDNFAARQVNVQLVG